MPIFVLPNNDDEWIAHFPDDTTAYISGCERFTRAEALQYAWAMWFRKCQAFYTTNGGKEV